MKITITEDGYLPASNEQPIPGRLYYLFDAEEYTDPQRKLWEALVDEWHKSGKYSFDTIDKYRFRDEVKLRYGEGFDRMRYVNDKMGMVEVKSVDEIPENVMLDFGAGNRSRVLGILKSTTRYTRKQFTMMIDNTIAAMLDAGVGSARFADIMATISEERK